MAWDWGPKTDFAGMVADALANGDVAKVQLPAVKKPEYAYFGFVGGIFNGMQLRLYPPFENPMVLNGQTYELTGAKRGKRKVYRHVEETA
jgi:hypothetical protein